MYKENNDTVLVRKEGKVAVITLNRPARYNAITEELKWGLLHALTDIQQDDAIKAIVLTGKGKGFCAGAGLGFALACDLRIMAEHANMRYAFINIGLVPDNGSTWFLTRQVGYSKALELIIEGEKVPAAECLKLNLTNKVCKADELMDKAMEWANRLANKPTVAIGATKRILNHAVNNDWYSTVCKESEEQMPLFETHDHKEGVMAFISKRKPVFKGK